MKRIAAIALLLIASVAQARSIVVFDLDGTLLDPKPRMIAILRAVGWEIGDLRLHYISEANVSGVSHNHWPFLPFQEGGTFERIFGGKGEFYTAPFGRRFYGSPEFLRFDTAKAGAPEFVERVIQELDADVLYLTGRDRILTEETIGQLKRYDFPGYGSRAQYKDRVSLVLQPTDDQRKVKDFKVDEIKKAESRGKVIMAVDDDLRNIDQFKADLSPDVLIVRIVDNVLDRTGVPGGVIQISNYLYDNSVSAQGKRETRLNGDELTRILRTAKGCISKLSGAGQ